VEAGIENAVATPAITAALYARFVSRQDDSPTMKAVAAMRNQFGGHAVKTAAPLGGDVAGEQRAPEQSPEAEQAGAGTGREAGES
jgi:6-phosphogluconate dehydrogenase